VPLVLCVPASDIVNTPPFKSTPDPCLSDEVQEDVNQSMRDIESESTSIELKKKAAKSILSVDPDHAMANYVLGRYAFEIATHWDSAPDTTAILGQLISARDNDVCPLLATTRIENAVRSYRDTRNIIFVDSPSVLDQKNLREQQTPDGIADPRRFVDHVHPTIEGHQAIATEIYHQFIKTDWVKPVDNADQIYAALVEDHLKTLGEEYYARAEQRLDGVKRWFRRLEPLGQ